MNKPNKNNSILHEHPTQDKCVLVTDYPAIAEQALLHKHTRYYDVWLCLREMYKHQGNCSLAQGMHLITSQFNITNSSAYKIIREGNGIFWNLNPKHGEVKATIWLLSIVKVCRKYNIDKCRQSVVIDLRDRQSVQKRRSGIYEAAIKNHFEKKPGYSTRKGIAEHTGVSISTQHNYEKLLVVDKKPDFQNISDERKNNISIAMKKIWDDDLKNGSKLRRKYRTRMKQLLKDPIFIQKHLESLKRTPNKPESKIMQSTPHFISYVGDSSFWRTLPNGKHSNPDFIVEPIKQTRKVIFYHGNYWHRNELQNRGQDLINQWNKIGYECLIVWEDESEEIILDKIRQFSVYQLELF